MNTVRVFGQPDHERVGGLAAGGGVQLDAAATEFYAWLSMNEAVSTGSGGSVLAGRVDVHERAPQRHDAAHVERMQMAPVFADVAVVGLRDRFDAGLLEPTPAADVVGCPWVKVIIRSGPALAPGRIGP